jgi:dipeptidyl aminopeptidase/acylaminoacyl peptidase
MRGYCSNSSNIHQTMETKLFTRSRGVAALEMARGRSAWPWPITSGYSVRKAQMMRTKKLCWVLLTISVTASVILSAGKPNFTGTWKLNHEKSPEIKAEGEIILEISHSGSVFRKIEKKAGEVTDSFEFTTDGKSRAIKWGENDYTIDASWKGKVLITNRTAQSGLVGITQEHTLSSDGTLTIELTVWARTPLGRVGKPVKWVFDRQAKETEASSDQTSKPAAYQNPTIANKGDVKIRSLSPPGTFWIDGVSFSSDGKWLVTHRSIDAKYDSIFATATGSLNELLDKVETNGHANLVISADSRFCALKSYPLKGESNIKVYRLPDFSLVRTFRDADVTSGDYFWMPDNKSLLVQNQTKLSIWSVETGEMTLTLTASNNLKVKAISRDGKHIACAMVSPQSGPAHENGYRVEIIPVEDPSHKTSFVAHKEWIATLEFSPDASILASASADKMIKFWSVPDGKLVRTLEGHDWVVKGLRFTSDGKTLVSVCIDETIRFWEVSSGTQTGLYPLPGVPITCLDISPDGTMIALGDENGKVSIFDYQKLKAGAQK